MEANENGLVSLDLIAGGDALMKFNRELGRVTRNILDMNTDAKKKRTITLKIDFVPDEARSNIITTVTCKSTLAPESPAKTLIYLALDASGKACMNELGGKSIIPGQMNIMGQQEGSPAVIDYRN